MISEKHSKLSMRIGLDVEYISNADSDWLYSPNLYSPVETDGMSIDACSCVEVIIF